jgi:hypothetical protein
MAGYSNCYGRCKDTRQDFYNCGACGITVSINPRSPFIEMENLLIMYSVNRVSSVCHLPAFEHHVVFQPSVCSQQQASYNT